MKISESITIGAGRERVFGVFSDIPNAAQRIEGITRIEMLGDGPVGVGTKWRETRLIFGREHTETLEITQFRAPEFYEVGSESCGTFYRSSFEFKETAPGTTEVTMMFGGTPRTIVARIMGATLAPMMKRTMHRCLASDLAALKRICEGA